jgi:hypothetical protein
VTITNTTEKLRATQQVINSMFFMKSKGSSPCSKDPATVPYPETDESSLHPPNSLRSILALSFLIATSQNVVYIYSNEFSAP